MPTYDYVCLKCGREFEAMQRISEDPLNRCILGGCDGAVRRRVGAGSGIIFKGSGFYETDYKRKNGNGSPSRSKSSGDSASSSSSGASGASDAGSAEKSTSSSSSEAPAATTK